jgi:hypothetical protein
MVNDVLTGQWSDIGTTETIDNCPNPDFAKSILTEYIFETHQPLYAEVLDYDGSTSDFIGSAGTTIGEIVGSRTKIIDIKDKAEKITGKIIFRVEPANDSREELYVQFKGVKLANREWFSKSDPFLCLYRIAEDSSWLKTHTTEYIGSNLNPVWKPFNVTQ